MRGLPVLLAVATLLTAAAAANPVSEAVNSVVEVRAPGSTGTGFVIEGGRVVTAAHVVESSPVSVVTIEATFAATVVHYDPAFDLAVLLVEEEIGIQPLELSEDLPSPAETVYAATAQPFGGTATVSRGIVSGVVRQPTGQVVQTDAAVNPGSSGGPLLREDGVVVGVTSSKLEGAEGVAFAIPTTTLLEMLDAEGSNGTPVGAPEAPPAEGAGIGTSQDRSMLTRTREWLPVAAPVAVLLTSVLLGGFLDRRRRRRPPAPGPFDLDIRLHDARTSVKARPDNGKDV